jgi:undecaprenyl-diphosphatase
MRPAIRAASYSAREAVSPSGTTFATAGTTFREGEVMLGASRDAEDVIDDLLASDIVDEPAPRSPRPPHVAAATLLRRRRWGREAALVAVTLGAVGGFLVLARAITGRGANRFDQSVVRRMGSARSPLTNALVLSVTSLGGATGALGVSLAALAASRRRPRLAWQIATGSLGGAAAELVIKRIFQRKRPTLLPHLEVVTSSSFPSGHAMAASSLYLTLAFVASRSPRLRKKRFASLASAAALATLIGATRVYLGVHWPTDVVGGLALGTAWACANEAVFDFAGADLLERETLAQPDEAKRP